MSKFKVGERYKVSDSYLSENGDVIEITKVYDRYCTYKTVKGKGVGGGFNISSCFAEYLKPLTTSRFKLGDTVKAIHAVDNNVHIVNKIGTIIDIYGTDTYGVEFDEDIDGHSCSNKGKFGYCWYCGEADLVEAHEEKIVITITGKTTTAKLYDGKKFVKEAKAKCSPEDEFNIVTGAVIAFSRLFDADVNFVDENDSFDWNAFKNDKVFVQVTKDNFDEFIEEAEKHDCFFHNHDKFNPFNHNRAFADLILIKMLDKDSAAPDGTLFVGYQDEKLKVASINTDNKTVFVW